MNTAIEPYQTLIKIFQHPEIKENAREINELLGLLCAFSASPQPLDMQDWLPSLWAQGTPSFSNATLASDFASASLQFYDHCLNHYQQSIPLSLPTQLWLDQDQQITDAGIAFASGYLFGIHSTEGSWQAVNLVSGSEPEQLLQTTTLLLSKMAAINSHDPQMHALFVQLPSMDEIIKTLPSLLSALGHFSVQVNLHD